MQKLRPGAAILRGGVVKLKANLVNEALKILNAKIGTHTGENICKHVVSNIDTLAQHFITLFLGELQLTFKVILVPEKPEN